jgi:hypothetical protein
VAISCSPREVDESKLREYILDTKNGVVKLYERNGLIVKVKYKPNDFFSLSRLRSDTSLKIENLRKEIDKKLFMTLSISLNGHEIENTMYNMPGDFGKKIEALSFGMNPYLFASNTKQDTIPMLSYYYERTFGVKNSTTFLLTFDRKKVLEEEKFDINVSLPLINLDNVSFSFLTSDIKKVPSLKID